MGDVTALLKQWRGGDDSVADALMAHVYGELRRIAAAKMAGERPGHTLQPTALVHEAYDRLAGLELSWQDRAHFLSMATIVMRRLLVEHARRRSAAKRGDPLNHVSLHDRIESKRPEGTILALHDALEGMREDHGRQARALELHYFGGLTQREMSEVLGVSQATVERDLKFGKAWLRAELEA